MNGKNEKQSVNQEDRSVMEEMAQRDVLAKEVTSEYPGKYDTRGRASSKYVNARLMPVN